jgi:membrane protein DedA with SNARE-associated domain
LMISYAFIPIPSNHVFIAAGLAKVKYKLLATSFFIGRLISYTFWVHLTSKLADNLTDLFSSHYAKAGSVVVEILGIGILYMLGNVGWKKILKKFDK